MKIGFFTDTYLPVTHGVVTSIQSFERILKKGGHKVFIYAPRAPGYKDKNPDVLRFCSIRVIKKPEMRLALPFWPKDNLNKALGLKLDIAHAHTPFSMGLLAKHISNKQKIPLVYTHHTHYPEYAKFYIKEKMVAPRLAKHFSAWFSNQSDAIIAPSAKMKRLLLSYGVKRTKPIYILATGINLKLFKKTKKDGLKIREKLKISPDQKVLIFVGRMGNEKNPKFLLEVMSKVLKKRGDILLLMVGDGPALKELQRLTKKLSIRRNVIFTKNIPYRKVPDHYQASDIFVFPSLTDTQGIVILEAMASGLPVVALKDDAFSNVVINNKNGFLIEKESPGIFAKSVLKILDNPRLYRRFSSAAFKISKDFSEENQAERLLKIYKKVINK